ncbi:MAG TPA: hypothetical protein VLA92_00570 [Candidatus Saccharimonadales bacterium]|nr:hypothetical protein [Candidatus Saccharimonadales bacterium]
MATAKKKTAPKKPNLKKTKPTAAKQSVAAKPQRTKPATVKQPETQYSTRVQVFATLFALLCVVFAAMAYTNY